MARDDLVSPGLIEPEAGARPRERGGARAGASAAEPSGPPPGTGAVPPRAAVEALRDHPHFQEATRAVVGGLIERYSGDGLLNRVLNDRGRMIGSLIALYLHFSPAPPGDGDGGFTVGGFQAFCVDLKLCSPGRARALLLLLRYAGYLAPEPSRTPPDRRQRRLAPTPRLIEEQRQRWRRQFEAIALITPAGRTALEAQARPEFMPAFVRRLGAAYIAGFRLLDHAPDLARLVESNAGLIVVASLLHAALDGPVGSDGVAMPISISSLAARFGIARAHARNLLAGAAEAGLVRRTGGSETVVVVLPRLVQTGSEFFAALFAVLAHCAQAAAEEIGAAP